jgi:hypothetical protein
MEYPAFGSTELQPFAATTARFEQKWFVEKGKGAPESPFSGTGNFWARK